MYKQVRHGEIIGYSFVDVDGDICHVAHHHHEWPDLVSIGWEQGSHQIYFSKNDIPDLIKALEAIYKHKEA